MGFLYIFATLPLFYTIALAVLTYINSAFVRYNTPTKKTIRDYHFLICLVAALIISLLTNGDSTINTVVAILGVLSIPADIILQFILWGIIALQATTWEERKTIGPKGDITLTWVASETK